MRGYFTVGLAGLILEDRASAAKKGEPPALDGDPFVGHQDWDISDLAIDVKDKPAAAKAIGTVSFNNAGKPEKVVIELLRNGKDWRIADIKWDASSLRALYRKKTDAASRIDGGSRRGERWTGAVSPDEAKRHPGTTFAYALKPVIPHIAALMRATVPPCYPRRRVSVHSRNMPEATTIAEPMSR